MDWENPIMSGLSPTNFYFTFWLADDFNHVYCAYLCRVTIESSGKELLTHSMGMGDIESRIRVGFSSMTSMKLVILGISRNSHTLHRYPQFEFLESIR